MPACVFRGYSDGIFAGDVGIGTTGPGAKLEVAGDGATILVPRKSASGDPPGTNGMIYYNSDSNKFRCYENGAWKDCIGSGGSITRCMVCLLTGPADLGWFCSGYAIADGVMQATGDESSDWHDVRAIAIKCE